MHDGRSLRRRSGDWSRRAVAEPELLFEKRLEGPLGRFLAFEELLMEPRRLLGELLERDQMVVRLLEDRR